jgi:hypothetical protein
MKTITIDSLHNFKEYVSDHEYHQWMYRGQNKYEHELESSLYRAFLRNEKIRSASKMRKINLIRENYEKEMIDSFQRSSHLFLKSMPDKKSKFDWLSIMQHYGAPTRLLDFSFSPYIALFFAISKASNDAAVYCVKYPEIKEIDIEYYKNLDTKYSEIMKMQKEKSETILVPFETRYSNERLLAQQGVFLIPNTLNYSHHQILENYENENFYIKLKIEIQSFASITKELLKMNITASTMYPGFEGFCKSFETIGIIPINNIRPISELIEDMN